MNASRRLLALAVLVSFPSACLSDELGFEFSGSVTNSFNSPWGIPIAAGNSVTGRFNYDTTAAVSYAISGCDCLGYRQQHINGFWADFGGVRVQANDYVIEVRNDDPASSSDSLTIMFSSELGLSDQLPLLVDGQAQSVGVFRVDLIAPTDTFLNANLPMTINPASFALPFIFNGLGAAPSGLIDVFFSVDVLSPSEFSRSDHDLDGDVDGGDFLIWQQQLGVFGQNGDSDGNWEVNGEDLQSWKAEFGMESIAIRQFMGIPEPQSAVGTAMLVVIAFLRSWRRSSTNFRAGGKNPI